MSTFNLKITSHLPNILQLISSKPIIGISAPTGYGKSIGIPMALAQAGVKTFISVPTVASAISLYNTIKKIDESILVGYAAEGKANYDKEKTMVVYATNGHIKNLMLKHIKDGICSDVKFATVLILDEIHNESINDDIIMALWKHCGQSGVQIPRLVLSSADLDRTKFSNMEIYEIKAETYPITINYHPKNYEIDDNKILSDMANIIKDYHNSSTKGHFLVFVEGTFEVETLISTLTSFNLTNVILLPAYSNLSQEQISKIFDPVSDPNQRKIVIATNIAESSITIENIGAVFDSLKEKIPEMSMTGGLRLSTRFISKASANQRCGRTGRTMPGLCYRMMTKEKFETLENQRTPEIQRVPIYETVMEILDIGLEPLSLLPISANRMIEASKLLSDLGMIDEKNKVTALGHFVTQYPLSVRNAAILWYWIKKDYPIFPCIVTVAIIDSYGPSYMWYPRRKENQIETDYQLDHNNHREKYFNQFEGRSDVHTFLNIWSDLMSSVGGMEGARNRKNVLEWANANSMNNKKFREVINIIDQSINTTRRLKYKVEIGPFTTEGVIKLFRPIAAYVYQNLILDLASIRGSKPSYRHTKSRISYILEGRSAVNNLSIDPPEKIIALITIEIKGRESSLNIVSVALDYQERKKEKMNEDVLIPLASRIKQRSRQSPSRLSSLRIESQEFVPSVLSIPSQITPSQIPITSPIPVAIPTPSPEQLFVPSTPPSISLTDPILIKKTTPQPLIKLSPISHPSLSIISSTTIPIQIPQIGEKPKLSLPPLGSLVEEKITREELEIKPISLITFLQKRA